MHAYLCACVFVRSWQNIALAGSFSFADTLCSRCNNNVQTAGRLLLTVEQTKGSKSQS